MFVLYADYRFGWGPREVGWVLAAVGVFSVIVQARTGRQVVPRLGERRTLLLGLACGVVGFAIYALRHGGAVPVRHPGHGDLGAVDAGDAGADHAPGRRRRAGPHPGRAEEPGQPCRHRRPGDLRGSSLCSSATVPRCTCRARPSFRPRDAGRRGLVAWRVARPPQPATSAACRRASDSRSSAASARSRLRPDAMPAIATIAVQKPRSPVSKNGGLEVHPERPGHHRKRAQQHGDEGQRADGVVGAFGAARGEQLEAADDQVAGVLHRVHRPLEALLQRAELLVGDAVSSGRKSGRARAPNSCRCGASIRRRRDAPAAVAPVPAGIRGLTLRASRVTSKRSTAASKSLTACR